MRRSRLEIVKFEIMAFFDDQKKRVYTPADLLSVVEANQDTWQLPRRLSLSKFVDFLEKQGSLTSFAEFNVSRFFWRTPTVLEIALSFRPNGYLSHYSAMHYYGLVVERSQRVVYVNDEQPVKQSSRGVLTQTGIDTAFSRPARLTQNVAEWGDISFYLLNGKHTGRLGVVVEEVSEIPVPVRVTSLERTLVDAVVRPRYAGGVDAIVEAYRRAAPRVSVAGMLDILQQLDYLYPYHQSIGFYLDYTKSYASEDVELFSNLPREYDFYLDNQMRDKNYSDKWKVYYPAHLG